MLFSRLQQVAAKWLPSAILKKKWFCRFYLFLQDCSKWLRSGCLSKCLPSGCLSKWLPSGCKWLFWQVAEGLLVAGSGCKMMDSILRDQRTIWNPWRWTTLSVRSTLPCGSKHCCLQNVVNDEVIVIVLHIPTWQHVCWQSGLLVNVYIVGCYFLTVCWQSRFSTSAIKHSIYRTMFF